MIALPPWYPQVPGRRALRQRHLRRFGLPPPDVRDRKMFRLNCRNAASTWVLGNRRWAEPRGRRRRRSVSSRRPDDHVKGREPGHIRRLPCARTTGRRASAGDICGPADARPKVATSGEPGSKAATENVARADPRSTPSRNLRRRSLVDGSADDGWGISSVPKAQPVRSDLIRQH